MRRFSMIAPVATALAVFAAGTPAASAQDWKQGPDWNSAGRPTGIPARGVGQQGVRVRMPGMANPGRSLPIYRPSIEPGFTPVAPGSVGGVPVVVPGFVGDRAGYVVRDGLVIRGSYEGDRLGIDFRVGGFAGLTRDGRVVLLPSGLYPRTYYHGGYNPGWYYDCGRRWSSRPVDGAYAVYADPSLLSRPTRAPQSPPAPEPERTDLEWAWHHLASGEAEEAVRAFEAHLEGDPEDVAAVRGLGLALFESGRLSDGISMVALAYRTDALLARRPIGMDEVGLDARSYRRMLGRALAYARRTDAPSAHLTGLVLLQADGKVAGALRVLERAERAGLEMRIADAFRRELGHAVPGG